MSREDGASAQLRIAASTPKTMYGEHENKLLPLTGTQFLRSDICHNASDSRTMPPAKGNAHLLNQHQSSDFDDSPLSGAELSEGIESSPPSAAPSKHVPVPAKSKSSGRRVRMQAADALSENEPYDDGSQSWLAKRRSKEKGNENHPQPARKKGQLKRIIRTVRDRHPPKKLALAPGTTKDESFVNRAKITNAMLTKDHTSSTASNLLDELSSDDADVTPAKRKAKALLTTIRKRLRSPPSGQKSLQRSRGKLKAAQITPTGSQLQRIVGDGFEHSELAVSHSSLYATKHPRRRREPLLAGLQALTIASGPLPDVNFVQSGQLDFEERQASHEDTSMSMAPAMIIDPTGTPTTSSNRRVSFKTDHDHIIAAQLASVSPPRRERSLSSESEQDDGDEGGDEDQDDAAADTYLDEEKPMPEDDQPTLSEDDEGNSSPQMSPEPKTPGSNPFHFLRDASMPARRKEIISAPSLQRSRTSGQLQRTRSYLKEVNEPIDDDFRADEMLLSDKENSHKVSTENTSDAIDAVHTHLMKVARSSHQTHTQKQVELGGVSSIQPRSVLKNNTPHVPSDHSQPESRSANIRRNSMVDIEESGYFSAAQENLDSTPTKQVIIRKKSGCSRYHAPVEVPYSDTMVAETTPERPDYTNATQLHTLRRNSEAVWSSSAAPVPPRDLRSLTRSVSRENGTLSQSVRRRSILHFHSPMIGR